MHREATPRELRVTRGDLVLAGSLWLPAAPPLAAVLMHPGSGPSDRDNDVYFPPIREHLLGASIAVASFDKRGVGGSSGRWVEAAIVEQADDALACLDALVADAVLECPIGLFGHSQGGWVVVAAAARADDVAFAVVNAGPGVTPAEQERWATRGYMRRAGIPETEAGQVERFFDFLLSLLRAGVPFDEVRARLEGERFPTTLEALGLPFLPEDADVWQLAAALIDHDPRPALERLAMPLLVLFGEDDEITPVAKSVAVYRAAVRRDLLRIETFSRADHRIQLGDPPQLADGYLKALSSFVLDAVSADGR